MNLLIVIHKIYAELPEHTWRSELLCRIELLAKSCSIPSEVCIFSVMLYVYIDVSVQWPKTSLHCITTVL